MFDNVVFFLLGCINTLFRYSLFYGRCAYCNLSDKSITTYFEVEHFVSYKKFEELPPELKVDYNNLMYSCKKCNQAKSNIHDGDFTTNLLFYNPVEVDMNKHFYRYRGKIEGKDKKAKKQIIQLKQYRPIYRLAWIVEKLQEQIEMLTERVNKEKEDDKKIYYKTLIIRLNVVRNKYNTVFIACYKEDDEDSKEIIERELSTLVIK